ncbi:MAG TPA: hypothetical protein VF065_19185, partial [Ilumatobacter sp.]
SNTVPITAWNIPVTVVATTSGSAKFTVNLRLLVRADVHRFRERPGGPADGIETDVAGMAILMGDSSGSWSAGGSFSDGTCTHTLSGSGTLSLPPEGGDGMAPFLMGLGYVDRQAWRIEMVAVLVANAIGLDNVACPMGSGMTIFPVAVPPAMSFELDPETYELRRGETTFDAPPFHIKATWEPALPFSPPTDMTPS